MAKKEEVVEITHKCGHTLGAFQPDEDHSSVTAICPKCKKKVTISNGQMSEFLDNQDSYDFPAKDGDCSFHIVEAEIKS